MSEPQRNHGTRRTARVDGSCTPAFEALEARLLLDGYPVISELMAINSEPWYATNPDSDWDWIEVHNPGAGPIALDGWHLTDNPGNLTKWTFPAGTTLEAGAYRIVFASNFEGVDPAHPADLHANFKLDGDGDYLALVRPGGLAEDIVHEYYPT
ncbi:MAG TPA: lamin tail domain-containing protein, partial [Phycisphaerae bacterium]|nr:lamin tail domain-containing protein [Phycisphaerae bacterium]